MTQKNMTSSDLQNLAAQALSDLTPLFLEHTTSDVQSMLSFLEQARSAKPALRFSLIREDFFRKAHDMKGEGATFDYPLLTFLGTIICDYLRNKTTITPKDLDFLTDCLADVQTILNKQITGEGGQIGQRLRKKWGSK